MSKVWLIMRAADRSLVERPDIASLAEALEVAKRLAAEDVKARFVVLEAVARTAAPEIKVDIETL